MTPRSGPCSTASSVDPDIVHVVNPILMGAHALDQVAGRYPSVASFHTDVSAYAARYHLGWTRPILHSITREAYRRADRRLATPRLGCPRLAELGVDDVSIWPPGVDERLFVRRVGATANRIDRRRSTSVG
jgi:hypothetical protein